MTDCTRLSDRMIAVAHDRDAWTAEETAHFSACADCRSEWQVVQRGLALGAAVARTLPADFIATRVVAGLRGRRERWWKSFWRPAWRWAALPMAAAAAFALLVLPRQSEAPGTAVVGVEIADVGILPELDGLGESDLESVFEWLPAMDLPDDIRSFDDLTEDEISHVLTSLEG